MERTIKITSFKVSVNNKQMVTGEFDAVAKWMSEREFNELRENMEKMYSEILGVETSAIHIDMYFKKKK